MGGSISILCNPTIKHWAVKWHKLHEHFHGTYVKYLGPFDGHMMYTYIDFEYHSHILTKLNLILNKLITLSHVSRWDQC